MTIAVPSWRDAFAQLIAVPTISSTDPAIDQSNRPAIELLASWFADAGCRVTIQDVARDKANMIAMLGCGAGGLVLSGHIDTVPFSESAWQQDPFTLTERDDRLYGLGASDMKCFFPVVLAALRGLDRVKLKKPVYVLATCDEESTMSGARALVAADYGLGRYALIGEPTGLTPIRLHKGVMFETITLTGQAGHASDPALGRSALEGMHAVLAALIQWRTALQAEHVDERFNVATPTVNFGSIHGGDNPNRICADCRLAVDVRLLPGMGLAAVRAQLRQAVMAAIDGRDLIVEFDDGFGGVPPFETDSTSELVELAEKLSGHASKAVSFATEGPYLNSLGMDTVILGPGDIAQAHQANEYIAMGRIEPMQKLVQQMITHICM